MTVINDEPVRRRTPLPLLDSTPELPNAACRDEDPELWFSEKPPDMRAAKEICKTCPVRTECLQWSLSTKQVYGIWGGMDEKKRRQLLGIDMEGKSVRNVQTIRCPNCRSTHGLKKSRGRYGRATCTTCGMTW